MGSTSNFFFLLPLIFFITRQPHQVFAKHGHGGGHAHGGHHVGAQAHGRGKAHEVAPSQAPSHSDNIAQVCSGTVNKALCVETIKSDPQSLHGDLTTFANIAITHAMNNASEVAHHISDLLTNTTDGFLQQCLTDCSENYMDAVDQLEDSLAALDSKGYNDIITWVTAAMTDAESCEEGFEGQQSLLKDVNTVFNQLCSNVLVIVDLLAH